MSNYHHGSLRESCILAGFGYIERGDFDFSLRDLAKSLEVSPGAPLRHFKNKEELIATVIERCFQKFYAYLNDSLIENSPKKSFISFCEAYVNFGHDHPYYYQAMFGELVREHSDHPALANESIKSFELLTTTIKCLQDEKIFKAGNTLPKAYQTWSSLHGLVSLSIANSFIVGVRLGMINEDKISDKKKFALSLLKDLSKSLWNSFKY